MTSEERLKIAEEFIKARGWLGIHVGGLWVTFAPDGHAGWCVFHSSGTETDPIACHKDQLEALYLARQKLAGEREAKKSPREKRLETSLKRMLEATAHLSVNRLQVYLEALDALSEES